MREKKGRNNNEDNTVSVMRNKQNNGAVPNQQLLALHSRNINRQKQSGVKSATSCRYAFARELKSLVSRRKRAEAEALLDELQNATLYRLRESSRNYEDEDNYRVVQEVREQFREWVIQ